ncbi:DUF502 domain-containing protein [Pelomicrobium sp.]|jgi:uncharacterized membrane protein|uniref:DUF502 domain-containing protein n=1 Tax=Pelomicrobium sp. TaxID=2815319 RepID=UPI002FDC8337
MRSSDRHVLAHAGRHIVAGILVLAPLWVTWLVFDFLLGALSRAGRPWVQGLAVFVARYSPTLAEQLFAPWFESAVSILFTLAALYALGWAASRVVGRRILAWLEALMGRIPLVKAVYSATKHFLQVIQQKPAGVERVVMIDFPHPPLKALGLVTRTLKDAATGQDLAVVYVPTAPNPTSGYVEIVPVDRLTPTDWTLEEAMRFTLTGGTSAPDHIPFSRP